MKTDPYREAARRNRKPLERVRRTEHEEEADAGSARAEQQAPKTSYYVLRLLLGIFILVPVCTFIGYTYFEYEPESSLPVVHEETSVEDWYEVVPEEQEEAPDPVPSPLLPVQTPESKEGAEEKQAETPPLIQKEEEKRETPPKEQEPAKEEKIIYHTVKPEETVFRISMLYFQSQAGIPIIQQANGLSGNNIRVGQVLKIPVPK